MIAKVIDCIVTAIEKEGISANLSAIIPKHISEREVNAMLAQGILQKLKEHSVVLGSFNGGTQIKLNDKGLTLDITADAVRRTSRTLCSERFSQTYLQRAILNF